MAFTLSSTIASWNLAQKKVLLRADLNVPIQDKTISNNYRLKQILPTLDLIVQKKGMIILATHIDRPTHYDPSLSTKILIPWFKQHGYTINFAPTLEEAQHMAPSLQASQILLLENLRFFPGEQADDLQFAQQLASLADFYVNDAFASLHRSDTSITLTPRCFSPLNRSIGLLVERELNHLNKLLINPKQPFILILGGGKVHDKIPLITNMISTIDVLILCPAIVFTFMHTQGVAVGKSLIDPAMVSTCHKILNQAKKLGKKILIPEDLVVAENTIDGPLSTIDAHKIPHAGIGISIGPQTVALIEQEIKNAGTIFYNGLMGFQDKPGTLGGANAVLQAMVASHAYTVVGGGDTVAHAESLGIANRLSFCSTGGGAALAYLSGQKLVGLEALGKDRLR